MTWPRRSSNGGKRRASYGSVRWPQLPFQNLYAIHHVADRLLRLGQVLHMGDVAIRLNDEEEILGGDLLPGPDFLLAGKLIEGVVLL
jgi:hypothetical protein